MLFKLFVMICFAVQAGSCVQSYVRRLIIPHLKLNSELNLDLELRIPIEMLNTEDLDLNLVIRLPVVIPINNQTFKFLDELGKDLYQLLNEDSATANQTNLVNSTEPGNLFAAFNPKHNQTNINSNLSSGPNAFQMRFPPRIDRPIVTGRSKSNLDSSASSDGIHERAKRSLRKNCISHRVLILNFIKSMINE
jgi:hypothetical protein